MQANDLRKGTTIILNGNIYVVTDFSHHTPGNKRAFVQATLQEIKTGKIFVQKLSSTESVEFAALDEREAQYLYHDDEGYHFMDLSDFHSFALGEQVVGDKKYYIKENDEVKIEFYEEKPVTIEVPSHVFLKITEAPPWVKGDSVSNNTKPAVLETGLKVNVPIFIKEGEVVKISTATGEYLGRQ